MKKKLIDNVNCDSFSAALSRLSEADHLAVNEAMQNLDVDGVSKILAKSGYVHLSCPEEISDSFADKLADSLLFNKVSYEDFIKSDGCENLYMKRGVRESLVSLDDLEGVISKVKLHNEFYLSGKCDFFEDAFFKGSASLINSIHIMDTLGFLSLRDDLLSVCCNSGVIEYTQKVKTAYDKKLVIKEDRSKAKKGKRNKHYDSVISIAKKTWDVYPNASVSGMGEEIWMHLRKDWKDIPVLGTVQGWLKNSGLVPNVDSKKRNRNFKLVH